MISFRALWLAAACATSAGCWEFLEPELPAENAAAVIQVNASLDEQGNLSVFGVLVPGLDADGFMRTVTRDTLHVLGVPFTSDTTLPSGARHYSSTRSLGPQILLQPFTVEPPRLADLAPGPTVRWYGPRALDPDTMRAARGSELLLRIAIDPNPPAPVPVQQWFLDLTGRDTRYQINATGPPPSVLRVPPQFIPEPADSVIHVALTSFQSAQTATGLYRGAFGYSVRLDWTIILR